MTPKQKNKSFHTFQFKETTPHFVSFVSVYENVKLSPFTEKETRNIGESRLSSPHAAWMSLPASWSPRRWGLFVVVLGSAVIAVLVRLDTADLSRIVDSNAVLTTSKEVSCSRTRLIRKLRDDPCYLDANRARIHDCNCRSGVEDLSNVVSYEIPPLKMAEVTPLDAEQRDEDLLLVFIHVNKAGGTSVKREVIFPTLRRKKWDGAAFGTFHGWEALGEPWIVDKNSINNISDSEENQKEHREFAKEPLYMKCGHSVNHIPITSTERERHCPLRAVWGSMSLGLCDHFPGRPCVYLIVLRDPVQRAISSYNYVCIEGAEGRKKWLPEWKRKGECPLTMKEYFDHGIGETNFLLWRLTRGCDSTCGIDIAVQNLKHPCMRFLILENLDDGLARLEDELGEAFSTTLRRLRLKPKGPKNVSPYHKRIKYQLAQPDLMKDLRTQLADDIKIYEAAKDMYAEQWNRPLAACPTIT